MGQKVDPNGLRTGIIRPWETKWYADKKHFADNLVEDNKIRKYIKGAYYDAGISKITIERAADKVVGPHRQGGCTRGGNHRGRSENRRRRQESQHQRYGSQTP